MDVQPDKQNIDELFSNTTFYIDFYQRQYKWNSTPVKRLLDDILYKFNEEFRKHQDSDIPLEQLINKYSWYYLNTYVTNSVNGKNYIVDGQQRLTTLTLILIKIYHLTIKFQSKLEGWVSNKIVGRSGYKTDFWMNHDAHKSTLEALYNNVQDIPTESGITAVNMKSNFEVISSRLEEELTSVEKLDSFIFYFLHRLVLINLNLEQTDVPMVFEVINDRGVKLKPFEILKGKLLGQVSKEELDALKLNELWEKQVNLINSYKENEIDQFFIYFLKSKFSSSRNDGKKYDSNYHRTMFSENNFELEHDEKSVKKFLQNEFLYFTDLYAEIYKYSQSLTEGFESVRFNKLNEMDMQFLLILSSCKLNDPDKMEKIKIISSEVDRLYCLLQLQRSYDSNAFARSVFEISKKIRNADISKIRPVFDEALLGILRESKNDNTAESVMSYGYFKETGFDLNKRFKRYFFARIDKFIADNTNMKMKHDFDKLVTQKGSVNGFHIEHILANNSDNLKLFDNDEEKFKSERNRLGGLLLLKGKDNISSNNETYEQKLITYANTLYWNETLREDSYKSKLDFKKMIDEFHLQFKAMPRFGANELEERHKLLFEIIKVIWK